MTLPQPTDAHAAEMIATREARLRRLGLDASRIAVQSGIHRTTSIRVDDLLYLLCAASWHPVPPSTVPPERREAERRPAATPRATSARTTATPARTP